MSNFLQKPLTSFRGVGPQRSRLLAALGLVVVEDLLWFFPRRYEDRRHVAAIASLLPGRPAVVYAKVTDTKRRRLQKPGLGIVTALLTDESGSITVSWFNRKGLEYILKEGTSVVIYGVPSVHGSAVEMSNPDFEVLKESGTGASFCGIIPIYPSTAGLPAKWFRTFAAEVIAVALPHIKETIPNFIIEKRKLRPLAEALASMHAPSSPEEWKESRRRLAYEEMLLLQTALAVRRKKLKNIRSATPLKMDGKIYQAFKDGLPFPMTDAQIKAIQEISADIKQNIPMLRLLQGDVGSGKTLVAVALAAAASDSGVQTAVLAPTEVLADQLYVQMEQHLAPQGVLAVMLKGSQTPAQRKTVIDKISSGEAGIIVGTQSLLEDGVPYRNLGVVIIDEQHRFGVAQRGVFTKRKSVPHMLMMSATPIPRTLSLSLFGDLDISVLEGKPAGRQKIQTRIIDAGQMKTLLCFIVDEIRSGGKVYWICPRVENSGEEGVASAEKRYSFLKKHLGFLGTELLHGKMDSRQKECALRNFKEGSANILVATTVVEVGVDIKEASVVVIESPERFGLSQLHQLRGRVGRGERRGVCLLLNQNHETGTPRRLEVLVNTDDGFKIAEADLALRGSGEISGDLQHGLNEFKLIDLIKDVNLITEAREDAAEIAENSEDLSLYSELKNKIIRNIGDFAGIG